MDNNNSWITDGFHHAEHVYLCQNLTKPNRFGDIYEKLLSDHYVLCSLLSNGDHIYKRIKNLHISSMQDTRRNIHTKFGSNWANSVRGEEF